ncbi:M20/M25/M40 family metallo-hydrolase [candidate division KSB1 bacterium]|nr:M20/M25/M40 family metallo-hydrolase [candidate division KSB1 bacterium]
MIDQKRIVELFLELVSIDGISLHERNVADYVVNQLKKLKINSHEDEAAQKIQGNCGNLIVKKDGGMDSLPALLLTAHLDTVLPTAALVPIIEGGLIKSNGKTILGADDRSGVTLILYLLEYLTTHHLKHRNLEIVFSVSEELGMFGTMALDYSQITAKEALVLDSSRPPGFYVMKTPTTIDFEIDFLGRPAHSGLSPQNGINALLMANEFINRFPLGKIDDETVTNVGVIQGGNAVNVVPSNIKISGEMRSFNAETLKFLQSQITSDAQLIENKSGGKIVIQFTPVFDGFSLREDMPLVQQLEKNINSLGLTPEPLIYFGGSDANVLNSRGIEAINLGVGVQNPHSMNEQIKIDDLVTMSHLLLKMAGAEVL